MKDDGSPYRASLIVLNSSERLDWNEQSMVRVEMDFVNVEGFVPHEQEL